MSHDVSTAPESAADQLFQLCLGYIPAICLNVAAKLSVAELLAEGPKTAEEIAAARDVDADALYRVLRALSAFGVFQEAAPRRFTQTPASDLLRADHPRSLRPFVMFFPDPLHFGREQFRRRKRVVARIQRRNCSLSPLFQTAVLT